MPAGGKGDRISILAIAPQQHQGYVLVRMRIPSRWGDPPKTAEEAFEMWWEYVDPPKMVVRSNLSRRLPRSSSHLEKVIGVCEDRKVNVLVYPGQIGQNSEGVGQPWTPAEKFVLEVSKQFTKRSYFKMGRNDRHLDPLTNVLQRYQYWLPASLRCRGSYMMFPETGLYPRWDQAGWHEEKKRITVEDMNLADSTDYAGALIMAWLRQHQQQWTGNLMPWRDTKKEYMEQWYNKQRMPRDVGRKLTAMVIESEREGISTKQKASLNKQMDEIKRQYRHVVDDDGTAHEVLARNKSGPGEKRPLKTHTSRQDKAGTSKWAKGQE